MADNYVAVNSAGVAGDTKMQTYLNTLGANSVHAEAVVLVDTDGNPLTSLNVNTSSLTISGNINATQSGTWNIGSITSNVNVSDAGGSLTVDGTVAATQSGDWIVKSNNASNFLATIAGTVTAVQSNASNFLSTIAGTVTAIQSNASNLAVTASQGGTWNIGTITTVPNIAIADFFGAANLFNTQVAATNVAATMVSARATRRSVTIRNLDATNSGYIGLQTVSSSNGMLLLPRESISVDYVGAIQVITSSGNANFAALETYD